MKPRMRRPNFNADGDYDSWPVMVPRNDKAGVQTSPERVRRLRRENPAPLFKIIGYNSSIFINHFPAYLRCHKADKHMSLATLHALMGHKKKETTLKYIHLARTNLRKEMVETAL